MPQYLSLLVNYVTDGSYVESEEKPKQHWERVPLPDEPYSPLHDTAVEIAANYLDKKYGQYQWKIEYWLGRVVVPAEGPSPELTWITNVPDPYAPFAQFNFSYQLGNESHAQQWAGYLTWIAQFAIGPPKPSEAYTVEQMIKQGYIGLYKKLDLAHRN